MNFKLTVKLSPDLRRRLAMESADTGKSNSQVVAELVNASLQLPADLKQFAAELEELPRRIPPRRMQLSTPAAKTADRQGKNTSLYLPAETELRLYLNTLKTGEDRMSTVIRLITGHIPPCGRYDPRIHSVIDKKTGKRVRKAA